MTMLTKIKGFDTWVICFFIFWTGSDCGGTESSYKLTRMELFRYQDFHVNLLKRDHDFNAGKSRWFFSLELDDSIGVFGGQRRRIREKLFSGLEGRANRLLCFRLVSENAILNRRLVMVVRGQVEVAFVREFNDGTCWTVPTSPICSSTFCLPSRSIWIIMSMFEDASTIAYCCYTTSVLVRLILQESPPTHLTKMASFSAA